VFSFGYLVSFFETKYPTPGLIYIHPKPCTLRSELVRLGAASLSSVQVFLRLIPRPPHPCSTPASALTPAGPPNPYWGPTTTPSLVCSGWPGPPGGTWSTGRPGWITSAIFKTIRYKGRYYASGMGIKMWIRSLVPLERAGARPSEQERRTLVWGAARRAASGIHSDIYVASRSHASL
jgi:hypothetical protein